MSFIEVSLSAQPARTGRGRTPSREMKRADVVGLLKAFESADVAVWIDGGSGVDALVGDQLRPHDDLDIVVGLTDVPAVRHVLRDCGYTFQESDAPLSFMMVDRDGRQVDVHPVAFDVRGNGLYQMADASATDLASTLRPAPCRVVRAWA
jgi:lincosamide nucleotidyltransferase A/C/D/E